jgi:hypothetical protein
MSMTIPTHKPGNEMNGDVFFFYILSIFYVIVTIHPSLASSNCSSPDNCEEVYVNSL